MLSIMDSEVRSTVLDIVILCTATLLGIIVLLYGQHLDYIKALDRRNCKAIINRQNLPLDWILFDTLI